MSIRDRLFPIQASSGRDMKVKPHPIRVPWSVAEKAYSVYAARYGHSQSLERLAELGGFGANEMDDYYPPWREEVSEIAALRAQVATQQKALRTRPDYDLRCDACGAPHNVDTSIPSDVWNQIAPDGGVLCTLCIDERMAAAGLTAEAEFYFVGQALTSRLYAESHGDVERLTRELADERTRAQQALTKLIELLGDPEDADSCYAKCGDYACPGDPKHNYHCDQVRTALAAAAPARDGQ